MPIYVILGNWTDQGTRGACAGVSAYARIGVQEKFTRVLRKILGIPSQPSIQANRPVRPGQFGLGLGQASDHGHPGGEGQALERHASTPEQCRRFCNSPSSDGQTPYNWRLDLPGSS